jgi:phosphatidylglycerol:prolipoprotein diacylglycerol transferase
VFRSPGAIALHVGPLTIRWYGVLIALAVLVGTTLAQREARRKGLDPEPLMNTIVIGIVAALVGARLYYVAFNWDYYAGNLTRILAVWEGGLAIHGGLLGGLLGGGAYALRRRLPVARYLDICAPSLILGQAIGRWGNFFNQEAFGTPTDLPWGLFIDPGHRPPALAEFEFFHPTFLYESLWNLLVFAVLVLLLRRPLERSPGGLFLAYLGLYSVGRFFIEGLRIDSLMLGPLRAAQVVSLLLVAAAGAGLLYLLRAGRPAPRST